jgi:hypothetical protein
MKNCGNCKHASKLEDKSINARICKKMVALPYEQKTVIIDANSDMFYLKHFAGKIIFPVNFVCGEHAQ